MQELKKYEFYRDENSVIYCGDNREVLPLLSQVDVIITDPPYGIRKADWDQDVPVEWISLTQAISPRALVMPGITNVVQVGHMYRDAFRTLVAIHLVNGMTRGPLSFGNWIPVMVCGEWDHAARQDHLTAIVKTNVKINHPCPKPLDAMKKLLKHWVNPEWLICDPFMGSGSTIKAAMDLGMRSIGIEISEKYCAIAVERLKQRAFDWEGVA